MKDLFYSENENIIFHVDGYSEMDNTSNVKTQISVLQNNYNHFSKLFKTKEIKTRYITKSSRYKYMRVFFATMEPKDVPSEAFRLGKDWTMDKWLTN